MDYEINVVHMGIYIKCNLIYYLVRSRSNVNMENGNKKEKNGKMRLRIVLNNGICSRFIIT
ncbi:hypothetical protein BLOT_010430 [Blomia tropicalis]|nr:hypothetical protein BLOT_010430 [Blomia tropicalis]